MMRPRSEQPGGADANDGERHGEQGPVLSATGNACDGASDDHQGPGGRDDSVHDRVARARVIEGTLNYCRCDVGHRNGDPFAGLQYVDGAAHALGGALKQPGT